MAFLMVAAPASALIPAGIDLAADTPLGGASTRVDGASIEACADAGTGGIALPVALPVSLPVDTPRVAADTCVGADAGDLVSTAESALQDVQHQAGPVLDTAESAGGFLQDVEDQVKSHFSTLWGLLRGIF